ncbi:MAG: Cof-type HAD-IIB family hydrolase [Spirochaetaceae bacterium]|jgi:Cof subfamily protein (haloacid dehalogenase superfamily)|nr:Cof-type HAD-IIB family hydrolase [Spirochaetaceae bacterium]
MNPNFDINTIKAIAIDLDGTVLLPSAILSDKTLSVFKKCMEQGLQIIIATGRSVQAAEPYRAALETTGSMVYYNGAEIVRMPENKIIHHLFLSRELTLACALIARRRRVHFHVFFADEDDPEIEVLMAENPSEASNLYQKRTGLDFQYGNIDDLLQKNDTQSCIKGLFIAQAQELEEIRTELYGKFKNEINIVKSAENFLEILNKKASKGAGLCFVMEERNLEASQIIAFGDEENDLSLFTAAGFSCAPGNARDTVKAAADLVIGANTENGVAEFLETYYLNRVPGSHLPV